MLRGLDHSQSKLHRASFFQHVNALNFYTILYLTSLNGKAAANQFGTNLYNFLSFVSVLHHLLPQFAPWGEVLPSSRLMGMCRWMGSHFHDWINYYGVWSYLNGFAHFQDFGGQKIWVCRDLKIERLILYHINVSVHFRMTKLKGFIR